MLLLSSLLFCSAIRIFAGSPSSPNSTNSLDFDWTDYLIQAPTHSLLGSSPQRSPHQTETDISQIPTSSTTIDVPTKTKSLRQHKPIDKVTKQIRNKQNWLKEKEKFNSATPQQRAEILASKRARQARYTKKIKDSLGHSSVYNARYAHLARLEESGHANFEQLQYLQEQREKKRLNNYKRRGSFPARLEKAKKGSHDTQQ
jgi:hypothetical protein